MTDPQFALWLALAAIGSFGAIIWAQRSVLLGFTLIAFLPIATAGFAGFLFGRVFSLAEYWLSTDHIWAISYTALGLLAFNLGVFLAWRPLREAIRTAAYRGAPQPGGGPFGDPQALPWLLPRLGMFCIGIGIVSYLAVPILYQIPTVRALTSSFQVFLQFGMLIILVHWRLSGQARTLAIALPLFIAIALFQAVTSGHIGVGGIFAIQALVVAALWPQPRLIVLGGLGFVIALVGTLMVGWLDSRSLIRDDQLTETSTIGQIGQFVGAFELINPLTTPPAVFQDAIFERVDMSEILAAQARHQPVYEAYANGATIIDDLAVSLVPRIFWPDKPVRVGGNAFASRYSGLVWDERTSVGLPYQFELYANGGVSWVIGGLFILGWLIARLELALFQPAQSLNRFLLLMMTLTTVSRSEQTITTTIMSLFAGWITVILVVKGLELFRADRRFWQPAASGPGEQAIRQAAAGD